MTLFDDVRQRLARPVVSSADASFVLGAVNSLSALKLGELLRSLDDGAVTRLLDALPAQARTASGYQRILVALGGARLLAHLGKRLQETTRFQDTAEVAAEVFRVLVTLPEADRDVVLRGLGARGRGALVAGLPRAATLGEPELGAACALFAALGDDEVTAMAQLLTRCFSVRELGGGQAAWRPSGLRATFGLLLQLPAVHFGEVLRASVEPRHDAPTGGAAAERPAWVDWSGPQPVAVYPLAEEAGWRTLEAGLPADTLLVFGADALRELRLAAAEGLERGLLELAKLDLARRSRALALQPDARLRLVAAPRGQLWFEALGLVNERPHQLRVRVERSHYQSLLEARAAWAPALAAVSGRYTDLGRVLLA